MAAHNYDGDMLTDEIAQVRNVVYSLLQYVRNIHSHMGLSLFFLLCAFADTHIGASFSRLYYVKPYRQTR